MEYLKLFENHSQYEDFLETEDFIRPNVSHCIQENDVHYNPIRPSISVDITVPDEQDGKIMLFMWDGTHSSDSYYHRITISNIDYVEIDGRKIAESELETKNESSDIVYYGITVSKGNHTVKFYLKDETLYNYFLIQGSWAYFEDCFVMTSYINTITFPSTIKRLTGYLSFQFSRDEVNIDFFNLEVVEGTVFGCNFETFSQEEQEYLLSIGAGVYCK